MAERERGGGGHSLVKQLLPCSHDVLNSVPGNHLLKSWACWYMIDNSNAGEAESDRQIPEVC